MVRRRGEVDGLPTPDIGSLRGDLLAILTEFSDRRSRITGLIAALPVALLRHELFMTMSAVPPETIIEIVDDVFLPLATNFTR